MTFLDESGLAAMYLPSLARMAEAIRRSELVAAHKPRTVATEAPAGIAVIPVHGPITMGATFFTELFGGAPLDRVQEALWTAAQARDISGIVLHINSPGGGVYGVDEAAVTIAEVAARKPVIVYTEGQMASAGYWLGSTATAIVAAPSAEIGSIGVYAIHEDWSRALDKEGVTPTLVKAGEFKAEGSPYFPLDDDARGELQARINDYYGMFVSRVARGRHVPVDTVRGASFGQGRVLGAREALAAGMIDAVGSFSDAVKRITTGATSHQARVAYQDEQTRLAVALATASL